MRAKGYLEYLKIGLDFANALTVPMGDDEYTGKYPTVVKCKGRNSVFAALSSTIPCIVRLGAVSKSPKGAISESEFCRFLNKSGYISYRQRSRIRGTTDKWNKGVLRWRYRRWRDPHDPDELVVLKAKIHEFRSKVAHLSLFCEDGLLEYLRVIARNSELDAQDFRNDTEIVPKCRIKVKREAKPNHQTHQANLLELLAIQQQGHSELDVLGGCPVKRRRFVAQRKRRAS
jgi:hypothetical protein